MALNYRTGMACLIKEPGISKTRPMVPVYGIRGDLLAWAHNEALAGEIAELLQGIHEAGDGARGKTCDMTTHAGLWRSSHYRRENENPKNDSSELSHEAGNPHGKAYTCPKCENAGGISHCSDPRCCWGGS